MNEYQITDNNLYNDYDYLNEVINYSLKQQKITKASFSIIFVNDQAIKDINKQYRQLDEITDVLSFAFEDNKKMLYNEWRLLGDIYICIPQMKRQAITYQNSEKRELAFLVVHGLLHLLGYDHQNEEQEKEMINLQEMILNGSNIKRGN